MKTSDPNVPGAPGRKARADGDATRQRILDVAGDIFAELGYEHATSKAICARAETNMAAVNYHFGGKEGLYQAVLVEVHRRLISRDTLSAIAASDASPADKLGGVIDAFILGAVDGGWHLRIYVREMLGPSAPLLAALQQEALPKATLLRRMLSDFTGIPEQEPALACCQLNFFAPLAMLLLADRQVLGRMLTDIWRDPDALRQHLKTYALSGLSAVAAAYAGRASAS